MPPRTKKTPRTPTSLPAIAGWVANESLMFSAPDTPFTTDIATGDPRLVIITGENASGKSLFFRIMCAKVQDNGALPVQVSIRERAGSGLLRAFMFGEEHEQSTGATSVHALTGALRNLNRPQGSILGLDEPELGLSDAYASVLGEHIGTSIKSLPPTCDGTIVVTHNRALVRGLLRTHGTAPTVVSLTGPANLTQWLTVPETRTLADLHALEQLGHDRWRWALKALGN